MEIYADIVFAVNFFMDSFILWVVAKLVHKKIKMTRILAGGATMALLYCMFIFFVPLHIFYNILASMLMIIVGVFIVFRPRTRKEVLKLMGLAYISAFAVGGMGIAMFYFTNISNIIGSMVGYTVNNFSLKILLASTCSFYIIIKLFMGWYKSIAIKGQVYYPVKIFYDQEEADLTALVDTGNTLCDPLSNSPVFIAEFNSIKNFLPDYVKVIFYENNENDLSKLLIAGENSNFAGRIRMIPFASLGKQNGMLLGFRPDKIEIQRDENLIISKDVIVGIYNHRLSADNSYQGLLNPETINV